jgi:hypothetical protein
MPKEQSLYLNNEKVIAKALVNGHTMSSLNMKMPLP